MKRSRLTRRPGFTLLETLLFVGCLSVCMLMGTVLITACLKAETSARANDDRVLARKELAALFRGDVARATNRPARLGEFEAGPQCLILALPNDVHVVYRVKDGQLERFVRERGENARHAWPLRPAGATMEFDPPGKPSGLVVMQFVEPRGDKAVHKTAIAAALGGDLQ